MKKRSTIIVAIPSIALILCALILGGAYKYKYHAAETITVTGLGEQEFTSDKIVWTGSVVVESKSLESAYAALEEDKLQVMEYITSRGIPANSVIFLFPYSRKTTEPIYSGGNYIGQRVTGYMIDQSFTIESDDVELVESVSREISTLIAKGIQIESMQPDYYYTGLDDLKIELIEQATADARLRAEKIASEAGCKLRNVKSARAGVFQITGANTNEEFSAGGNFNTSSKNKKARVTMRLEFMIK